MIGINPYLILLCVLRLNSYPEHERWQQWTSSEPVSSASRSRQTWFSTRNPRLLEGACFALGNMCDCINPGFKGLVETIQDSSRSHAPAITGLKALKMEVLGKRLCHEITCCKTGKT